MERLDELCYVIPTGPWVSSGVSGEQNGWRNYVHVSRTVHKGNEVRAMGIFFFKLGFH
jgi:hypothetical protein